MGLLSRESRVRVPDGSPTLSPGTADLTVAYCLGRPRRLGHNGPVNYADFDTVIQAVRFELYRENIYGALEMVEAAHRAHPDPRYAEQTRQWSA